MAEPVTNELLYEVLKSVQERLARLEHGQADLRGELHGMGEHVGALSASCAALVGDGLRRTDQIAELRARIERLERRLDLAEPSG